MAELEGLFLPRENPTGSYSSSQYDQVRAYIVLVHAEIETYIEDLVEDLLTSALDRWNTEQRTGQCVAGLMMYGERKVAPPKTLAKQETKNTFDAYLRWLIKEHREYTLQANHGIKETNILRMFLPLGIQENDLDTFWLGNVSSFGVRRGIVAHKSAKSVQNPPDPKLMKQAAEDVIQGLEKLELMCQKLKRR